MHTGNRGSQGVSSHTVIEYITPTSARERHDVDELPGASESM